MKTLKLRTVQGLFFLICALLIGCNKFLDERTTHAFKVPSTLRDLQALMDAENSINIGGYPFLLEIWTDNYQIDDKSLANMPTFDQSLYKFDSPEIYPPDNLGVWVNSYKPISISNTVLEYLDKMGLSESEDGKNLKGQALFHRAYGHFLLAQVFSLPFDKNSDNGGMGIPLRHTADAAVVSSKRNTIKETYDDILRDMNEAVRLLKVNNGYQSRPNKVSAYAALSKIYLAMELYAESEKASSEALALYSSLIDLNTIDVTASYPYDALNKETIFFAVNGAIILMPRSGCRVPEDLLDMFEDSDLRRSSYFQQEQSGGYSFKGDYAGMGNGTIFCGLTTSETLLNRSESRVRNGDVMGAKVDLNLLLKNRINKTSFKPISETDPQLLLKIILDERRKELINRNVRWLDLRRLNRDERFKKILVRTVIENGIATEYKLLPDVKNYVFKIPKPVIDLTGIPQN